MGKHLVKSKGMLRLLAFKFLQLTRYWFKYFKTRTLPGNALEIGPSLPHLQYVLMLGAKSDPTFINSSHYSNMEFLSLF